MKNFLAVIVGLAVFMERAGNHPAPVHLGPHTAGALQALFPEGLGKHLGFAGGPALFLCLHRSHSLMCVYVYMRIYVYVYVYMLIYTYDYIHTCAYVYMCIKLGTKKGGKVPPSFPSCKACFYVCY